MPPRSGFDPSLHSILLRRKNLTNAKIRFLARPGGRLEQSRKLSMIGRHQLSLLLFHQWRSWELASAAFSGGSVVSAGCRALKENAANSLIISFNATGNDVSLLQTKVPITKNHEKYLDYFFIRLAMYMTRGPWTERAHL